MAKNSEGKEMCEYCAVREAIPSPPGYEDVIACGEHFAQQKQRQNVKLIEVVR